MKCSTKKTGQTHIDCQAQGPNLRIPKIAIAKPNTPISSANVPRSCVSSAKADVSPSAIETNGGWGPSGSSSADDPIINANDATTTNTIHA